MVGFAVTVYKTKNGFIVRPDGVCTSVCVKPVDIVALDEPCDDTLGDAVRQCFSDMEETYNAEN